jgi:hypothetical protein
MPENDDAQDGKVPREKYEELLASLKTQTEANEKLRADMAFGNVKVSDRQRKIILRELGEDKVDVTAENVAEVAKELGFVTDQAPPPPPPNGDGTPPPNGDGQGTDDQQDQGIMVSLNEMNVIDRANFHARRGNVSPDLDTEMKNAKSPEELTSIIRTKGPASGLVHEWDTE